MKHSLLWFAALACLSSSLSAQWAHQRPGSLFPSLPDRFVFSNTATQTTTTLSANYSAFTIFGACADLAGGKLYMLRNQGNVFLSRWSFGSSVETPMGSFPIDGVFVIGILSADATFANGQIYFTGRHPTGAADRPNRIYSMNPATMTGATWLPEQGSYFNPKGIAFDASANRFLVTHYQDAPTPGPLAPGVYSVDAVTKSVSFFSALPASPTLWTKSEVALGRLWALNGSAAIGARLTNVADTVSVPVPSPAAGALAWAPGLLDNCAGTTYCTAGLSSNGCVPSICASGVPSATNASGFTLTIDDLDGQRSGLVLYGVSGPLSAPWAAGSTSYRCVNNPVQRMGAQNSGGTAGSCNGQLIEDWNTYVSTHPSALGQPFSGGESVWSQGWYRDPAAPKSSGLSNGLQFVVQP